MAEATSTQSRELLTLPLELREQIWHEVLSKPTSTEDLQLLRTCRQIYTETTKVLFKRPLVFESQTQFIAWAQSVSFEHLQHVVDITLRLVDIDYDLVPQENPRHLPETAVCWPFYEEELERLHEAMKKITNVRALRILRGCTSRRPDLQCDFEERFLLSLGSYWTKLESLRWSGDYQTLEFLRGLPSLRTLQVTGFSASEPSELLEIVRELPELRNLEILPCAFATVMNLRLPLGKPLSVVCSFSTDVLRQLPSLRTFIVHEKAIWFPQPYTFFTKPYLEALQQHHIRTLRSISIKIDFPPAEDAMDALRILLADASISSFGFGWHDMDESILESLLPLNISTLTLFTGSLHAATKMMEVLRRNVAKVPELRNLQFDIDSYLAKQATNPIKMPHDPKAGDLSLDPLSLKEPKNDYQSQLSAYRTSAAQLKQLGIRVSRNSES